MTVHGPIRITPSVQRYAWGDERFIPELLGLEVDGPVAEAWFGGHPVSSAVARVGEEHLRLDELIARDAEGLLGPEVSARFGGLPYLLKILAIKKPLSIQVHPNLTQAAEGFAREEAAGVPRDAPDRFYRDDQHKPELLVALRPTIVLSGFRRPEAIAKTLEHQPELKALLPPFEGSPAGLRALLETYYALPDERVVDGLAALLSRLEEEDARSPFGPQEPQYWALRAHRELGLGRPDRGLLFVFLLEILHLAPGQAIFLPAGVPHAYLEGAGVELMASSDNVLRAGLTPKPVNPAELLRIVRFDAGPAPILSPVEDADGVTATYPIPAGELELARVRLRPGSAVHRRAYGGETVLVSPISESGAPPVILRSGEQVLSLSRGQACFVPDGVRYWIEAEREAEVYVAGVPSPDRQPSFRGRRPTELAFGTSGLRGLVTDITDLEAYVNTRGFLDYLIQCGDAVPGTPVALAGDLRPSTDGDDRSILRAVARAVQDAGLGVVYVGRVPTPALTYFGLKKGWPSIMVTGSHIPFDRNGIKFNLSHGEVLKSDEAPILAAVARVRAREYARRPADSPFDDNGYFKPGERPTLPEADPEARELYRRRYLEAFPPDALAGVRLGLYEHSAVGRDLLFDILSSLGAEVHRIGRSETFVAIDTEAISADRMAELQALADGLRMKVGDIDALVSTDGDSDRPLLTGLDERGRVHFFSGDSLGIVVADYLEADAITVPVSATDAVDRHFAGREVPIRRTRIGSPWVIKEMSSMPGQRRVGFEANGGFLVGTSLRTEGGYLDPLPTRDAVLPLVAALRAAHKKGLRLVELFGELPPRVGRAGLLDHIPTETSRALIACFGPTDASVRRARYLEDEIRITDYEGGERSASAEEARRLEARRARLARYFSPERGFGRLEEVDDLDGIRMRFSGGDIAHVRPSGNAPQLRIYVVADGEARAEAIVSEAVREPGGILFEFLAAAESHAFVQALKRNIEVSEDLFREGGSAAVIGTVSGSERAQAFWQQKLDEVKPAFGARVALSLHEDLPVNQAFGLLLLWQRLRPHLLPGEGALFAFVFGEGTRSTPFTEAECGQKPAITSFVTRGEGRERRRLSIVELALRTFAPVEAYLRRSGFDGMVVKWGDEVQIPTRDLRGSDPLFSGADVVRFVSMRAMSADEAANKDWVGVDKEGRVTAFIPRRPLAEMEKLAERGLVQRRGEALWGGINLGSIGLSRALLDLLLEELEGEVNDAAADRKKRPDLDPQLFTALTVAAIEDASAREAAWAEATAESAALEKLERNLPGVLHRLRRVLDRFVDRHGRPIKMVAMDFEDQYWGDIGQHRQMYALFMALADEGPEGQVARALAGLGEERDENGNYWVGPCRVGPKARVRDSVLIDVDIEEGTIQGSVLIGTKAYEVNAESAFDIESSALALDLSPRAGSYKLVSGTRVRVPPGERWTTIFLPDGDVHLRVREDTDLRDRANTYDVPIFDNPVSFQEAHARVSRDDPEAIEARRNQKRQAVAQLIAEKRTSK